MAKVSATELILGAKAGKVVSFPTDTVPALATLPQYGELIFAAKKRPADKPLILMTSSIEEFWAYVEGTPTELEIWREVAQSYLPGALTLVLPACALVPSVMNPTDPTTIGLRVPNHQIARAILAKTGPLATTSANLSGESPLLNMNDISVAFPDVLTLDGEIQLGSGLPSTVIKWTLNGWQVLRQGSVIFKHF